MNQAGFPLLSLLTFLPLVGAAVIFSIRGDDAVVASTARWTALWTSLIVFVLSLVLWFEFDKSQAGFQFNEVLSWLPQFGVSYRMGVDGISVMFVLISTALTPIAILSSWNSTGGRVREYMIAFLVMETMMVGLFSALDFILFFVFFEGVLIPMFIIIGVWGGERRLYAAIKFFLFMFAGSMLMLLGIMALWFHDGTMSIPDMLHIPLPPHLQFWLFLAFLAAFAVKIPIWPVHTWLIDAHQEAPIAASVLLAGVLANMGGYGFLRFSLPLLPQASQHFAPLMFALGVIAVIYTSIAALVQRDLLKLVAYSSVGHMAIAVIGIFTFNVQGIEGSLFRMLSHGFITAALFLCVGVLMDRTKSQSMDGFGGVVHRMPFYSLLFMIFAMGTVGLPGTAGFVGEILVIVGALKVNFWVALLTGTTLILSAVYTLVMYRRVIFGALVRPELKGLTDIGGREIAMLVPLVVLTLWMGLYPSSFSGFFDATVTAMANQHVAAIAGGPHLASATPLLAVGSN
ncbi:NADH-quinone oxidoreductase subunit M [Acidisoma cladoniae]|jgi:NADH-quinone oxidoreductase subunit M|uniref:NADH-quinone oxidoreductase subunit M n=1 Tax=Acidisoma cladoniae TaxID=3040935 RepID=UPI00254C0C2F|nr:NADH-quinone oxidoreductase subunit M [Acidisoma sp. PAMC 29798]